MLVQVQVLSPALKLQGVTSRGVAPSSCAPVAEWEQIGSSIALTLELGRRSGSNPMAWLERRGRKYRLSFRYNGQMYRHSLGTADELEAGACLARLEEGIRLLERGRLERPAAGADLAI